MSPALAQSRSRPGLGRYAPRLLFCFALLSVLAACTPSQETSPAPPWPPPLPPGHLTQPSPTVPTPTVPMPTMPPSSTPTSTPTSMPNMGADQCTLPEPAFCDTFQTINPGGRAGDLDESKWSFFRVTQANNPSAALVNNYAPVNAEFCKTHQERLADNDSFICGQQFGESNHWMEAMNDQESYVAQGARVLQPFDFAGRTGTVEFSVDAKEEGSHSAWPEMWLTQDPMQGPHEDFPGTHIFPKEGLQIILDNDCPSGMGGLRQIVEYHNFIPTTHDFAFTSPCYTTQDDMANHFIVKISQSQVQVFASNAGDPTNLVLRASTPVSLPWSRGYLSFQHAQYDANKFNNMGQTTYHWHAIGFDGPVVAFDRSYQVPDALDTATPAANNPGSINLGYQTNTPTFPLAGVNPSGVKQAWVTFNVYWFSSPLALNVTVNGHTLNAPDPDPATAGHRYQWHFITLPVPLSDLNAGTNTVQISNTGCSDQCPTVANIDLELVPN